jgi:hypothetical protein
LLVSKPMPFMAKKPTLFTLFMLSQ